VASGRAEARAVDGDGQRGVAVVDGYLAVPCAGVPDGVGHRLDHDPVRRDLDRGGKRWQVVRGEHAGGELSPRGQPVRGQGARAGQAEFVQGRRAQPFDEAADVQDRPADFLAEIVQLPGRAVGAGREQGARRLGLQRQPGQGWADAVVQVAAEPAAFFLAGQDEAFPGPLQVFAQQPRVQRPPSCRARSRTSRSSDALR
jgi:hypothetical protein